MELNLKKWEAAMQADSALRDRLMRLNSKGYPATKKGDLLAVQIKNVSKPIVVSWDGTAIHVRKSTANNPFLSWSINKNKFRDLFISGENPPLLVAMNNDQNSIKGGSDHHNGSLVLSFMVMLQECAGIRSKVS